MAALTVIDAVGELLAPLLTALDRVEWVQRRLFPPVADRLAAELTPRGAALADALRRLEAVPCPPDLRFMGDRLVEVSRQLLELMGAFERAAQPQSDVIDLYRALRRFPRVQEALYPLAPVLEPVSRWFLEPGRRDDGALIARLRDAALRDDPVTVGVLHAANERDARGGFSLYVPESWDGKSTMPLVVALHGGHGHGRDFLWTWLREARSRGVLVLAPTSRDRTWSIMGRDDVDAEGLRKMLETVAARYPVERERVLLTGMSDGGTYALLSGLREDSSFTHLAPACGTMHPLLLVDGGLDRARGRPIYLIHGQLDWMFPVQSARMARDLLSVAGARLVYRELEDLSHTYPRDENPLILDWLMSA